MALSDPLWLYLASIPNRGMVQLLVAHTFLAGEMALVLTAGVTLLSSYLVATPSLLTAGITLYLAATPSSALTTCPGFPGYCSEAFPGSVNTSTPI